MATKVGNDPVTPQKTAAPSFVDKHLLKIAFALSTLALFIFSPLVLLLGTVSGFALHRFIDPELRLKEGDKIITVPNAAFAVVGAVAAFLRLTPVGLMGGFFFQMIPLASSLSIGSTAYRAIRSI